VLAETFPRERLGTPEGERLPDGTRVRELVPTVLRLSTGSPLIGGMEAQ
jgi:hypothetical protein